MRAHTVRTSLRLAAILMAAWLLPGSAVAGVMATTSLDRPDLLDVDEVFTPLVRAGEADTSFARVVVNDAEAYSTYTSISITDFFDVYANGRIYGEAPGTTTEASSNRVTFEWQLFEPDQVGRSERHLSLKQSRYLFVRLAGEVDGSTFSTSGLVEGCHAQTKVRDSRDGLLRFAGWRVGCSPRDLMAEFGFTSDELRDLFRVLGLPRPAYRNGERISMGGVR